MGIFYDKKDGINKTVAIPTGLTAAAIGMGTYAGTKFPGLRGGKGKILGSLIATKKLFTDLPIKFLREGEKGLYETILHEPVYSLKLDPTKIKNLSLEKAKRKNKNFHLLSPIEQLEEAKKYDILSTKQILSEEENKARAAGAKYITGASHFTPEMAARFGYIEAPEITKKTNKKFWGKFYYNRARSGALKKLNDEGLQNLNELDAYWLTADPRDIRLFRKDLTLTPEQVKDQTQKFLASYPSDELIEHNKAENAFKNNYDKLLVDIVKEKMEKGMFKKADIAVTYTVQDGYGMGHKTPANEMVKLIKEHPDYDGRKIDLIERTSNKNGVTIPSDKPYDFVFSSGHGAVVNPKHSNKNGTFHRTAKNLKYKLLLNYNPDIPFDGKNLNTDVGHKDSVNLVFGKDRTDLLPNSRYLGDISPLLNPEIVEAVSKPVNKEEVIKELAKTYLEKKVPKDFNNQDVIKQRNEIAKKIINARKLRKYDKLVTISGSGMGTYVSQRTNEAADALKSNNLNNVGVVALRATGHKDPQALADIAKTKDNVVFFDETLNNKNFNNLQRIADINWGSSGASSFQESLLADNIYVLPDKWGAGLVMHDTTNKTLAGRQHNQLLKLKKYKDAFNVNNYHAQDVFNSGQLTEFPKYEGTAKINSGEDLANLIKDEQKLKELKSAAVERSKRLTNQYYINRDSLKSFVGDLLKATKPEIPEDKQQAALLQTINKNVKNITYDTNYSKNFPYINHSSTTVTKETAPYIIQDFKNFKEMKGRKIALLASLPFIVGGGYAYSHNK